MNENNTIDTIPSNGYSLKSRQIIGLIHFFISIVLTPVFLAGAIMGGGLGSLFFVVVGSVVISAPLWIGISLLVGNFSKNQERALKFALLPSFYPFFLILLFLPDIFSYMFK
jgi:hypothetical protein